MPRESEVKFELVGRDTALIRDEDGRDGRVGDSEAVQATHEQWVVKMRGFQFNARDQLSGRVVSREEVTALVKKRRRDTGR